MFERFKKDRKMQIGAVLVAALVLLSGYLLFGGKSEDNEVAVEEEAGVQRISKDDLGLTMEANPAGNEVKFKIAKAKDFESVEYELTYEADSTAAEQAEGGEPRVQRGITGEESLNGDESFESEWLVLGSESAGTKRYDKGVESVSLTLKLNKSDGKIYSSEDSLELE